MPSAPCALFNHALAKLLHMLKIILPVSLRSSWFTLAVCLYTVNASASPAEDWIEVMGGSWKPDALVLSRAEAALKKRFSARLRHEVTAAEWRRYSFQYQGNSAPGGHNTIEINAFCSVLPAEWRAHFDLTREWVRVFGGGECFFRAQYDSTTRAVVDLKFNAPK